MGLPTPMTIRLYDENNEFVEFTRNFVPWKLLKLALKLFQQMEDVDIKSMSEDMVDSLASLVVEVFGNQFSIEDLNEKADISDMMSVITMIVSKASGGIAANPTRPA